MKRADFFFYALMIILYLLPFIPMSIKGIIGLMIITICSVKVDLKAGLIAATLGIITGFINFFLNINVDYEYGIASMLLGSVLYYITAFYFGILTKDLKNKNSDLLNEIESRKDAETELKKKLTLLQSLMDTMPGPIFFKDLNHRYLGCNRAFEAVAGVSSSELAGKTERDVTGSEQADIFNKMDKELLENLDTQQYKEIVRFADGSMRNIIFNKAVFTDENENPAGIIGVMTDITGKEEVDRLRQSMLESRQIIDEMLENDRLKTEFFSNVSHEFRTPLNVIFGSIQLMELYKKNNLFTNNEDKIIKNIIIIKQNCYRLMRLVNNLIDISKIDARAFQMRLENSNIVSVIEEISLSVAGYIENKGLKLIFDTDIEEKLMACDPDKIERIMLNLLSNAVKFTPEGGEIRVNVYDKVDGLRVIVEDNGIGIPEDKQTQIFQRFYQAEGLYTRQHEGSGIGLNLVKSLVELHGGRISFNSRSGEGTCFIIDLPYKMVNDEIANNRMIKQTNIERINIEFSDIYPLQIQ